MKNKVCLANERKGSSLHYPSPMKISFNHALKFEKVSKSWKE